MTKLQSAPGAAGDRDDRFDGERVRRILERAAVEQHRLDRVSSDTYSLEELEAMAAEARISPAALRAALDAERRGRTPNGLGSRADPAPWRGLRAPLPGAAVLLVAGLGAAALFGALVAFPALATALFWTTVLLALLLLLGASPF